MQPEDNSNKNYDRFQLIDSPLSADKVVCGLQTEGNGALVTFTGLVRNHSSNKKVIALHFEAYNSMAISELKKIEDEIKLKWPAVEVALHHRLGRVETGDIPVIAAAMSPHRKEAFEACEYLMNRLKQTVPIWKKEIFEDGEVWVTPTP